MLKVKWSSFSTVSLVAILFCLPSIAWAAESDGFAGTLIGVIASGVALVLSYVVTGLLVGLGKKFNVEVEGKTRDKVRMAVYEALKYATEWGAKKIKLEKIKVSGVEKMKVATSRLMEKVPGITEAEAQKLVEESLADFGEGATAAAKGFVEAASTPE